MAGCLTILTKDIRSTYTRQGIVASTGHFNDVWTRDAMFAAWGSLAIGDTDVVFRSLKTLLRHGKKGLIPLKVGHGFQLLKFIGIQAGPKRVWYTTDKNSLPPADSNSLFLITLEMYVAKTKDMRLLKPWNNILKIYEYLTGMDIDNDDLVEQGEYTDWADSLKRPGKTLYCNACYAAASQAMSRLAELIGNPNPKFQTQARATKRALKKFWNGKYFSEHPGNNIWDAAGNFLMVHWGLTTEKRIRSIISKGIPPPTTSKHAAREKHWLVQLAGMGDYHETQRWSWIGGLHLAILRKWNPAAHEQLKKYWQEKIIADDGVYEVYEPDGSPVRRLFYRSQKPFAWGSGMMIYGLGQTI